MPSALIINNYNSNTIISGSEYNDSIENSGNNVTIDAVGGADFIFNNGNTVSISGGDGSDTIENEGDEITISGGTSNDSIYNYGENVSIDAGDGADTIENNYDIVTISGGDGNDSIYNGDVSHGEYLNERIKNVTIDGGKGNDSITNIGTNTSILGGDGDDSIDNGEENVTIDGGAGSDTITNSGDYATIRGGDGTDSIYNSGDEVTVSGSKGNDSITNIGTNTSISGGAGSDTISNSGGDYATIKGGAGNDSISNSGSSVTIDGGSGNDSISNFGYEATIAGGAGNDLITNGGDNAIIDTDDGDDLIYNEGEDVSIDAGTGNDTISNSGENLLIKYSGGNDSIEGFNDTSTLQIYDSFSTAISGDDLIVTVGENFITLSGAADLDRPIIWGGGTFNPTEEAGDDDTTSGGTSGVTINNTNSYTMFTTTDYNDTITNSGENVIIQAQGGNDSISNSGQGSTIDLGAGNDTIITSGNNVIITPDAGDDLVSLASDVSGVQIDYTDGDGNDTIVGFNESSTLSVDDSVYSTQVSGNDLIITVGESKITLVDAANLSNPNIASTNSVVTLVENLLKRTAAGYPVIAGALFPETTFDEPTNYAAKDDWSIKSADDLELHGVCYTPENSNDKWVVLVHGYGQRLQAMYPFATFYLANNYNVLMIDQRAAGESEGVWLTMGAAESQDVALWTQEIARRNSNAKITLHGVSMGSATVMLAAARSDTVNVMSLVEDCGYSSVMELFALLNEAYGIGATPQEVKDLDLVGYGMTGYYLHDAAPINSISSAKMPTLFISGDADGVVPVSMLSELYDASGAEVKEIFTVSGADHAQAGLDDPIGYSNAVFRFVAEANGEGWNTENIFDDISLRGTKYNDTIANSGASVYINGGTGNDLIELTGGENSTVNVSEGNDTIKVSGVKNFYVEGFGSGDVIQFDSTVSAIETIDGGIVAGDVTIGGVSYSDVRGIWTLENGIATLTTATLAGVYADGNSIIFREDSMSGAQVVLGGITNTENFSSLMSGTDRIKLNGNGFSAAVTVLENNINATFDLYGEAAAGTTFVGMSIADSIVNEIDGFSVFGMSGNDTIISYGNSTIIDGGLGDDLLINVEGARTVFQYSPGDGNDTIVGFNDTSFLDLGDAEFTSTKSGNDVIINVGENNIVLTDAATLSIFNPLDIENETSNTVITGTAYDDTITNAGTSVTINAIGGDDYVANVVDSSLTAESLGNFIDVGDGNDTIFNYHTYNPTLLGGAGDDSIVVSRGHKTFVDAGDGNDTILGVQAGIEKGDWTFGGYATIDGGAGDDFINPVYANNGLITGGEGNDTIIVNGKDATIDGGAGENLIQLTTIEGGQTGQFVVFNGNTTVESFGTGFGEGSDTIYIAGDPAAVDFKSGVLTFYSDNDNSLSLTLSDVTTTAKVNLYHERRDVLNRGVFIAEGDLYSVESSDLSVKSGEEVYFVGPSSSPNRGVDFSGINDTLNVSLDTAYEDSEDFVPGTTTWINGVYSIIGGANLTTITGSKLSDTIFAGKGATTINAGAGKDILTGNGKTVFNIDEGATTTVNGTAGDKINLGDDEIKFIKGGAAYIIDGVLQTISSGAIVDVNGETFAGNGNRDLTVVDGEEVELTAADKKVYVGSNGATLTGYDIDDNAFVIDAATANDLIEKIYDEDFRIDEGTFNAENQSPVVLEDADTSKGTFVKFITDDGKKHIFGWDPEDGGLVDGSDIDKKQILFGAAPDAVSTVRGGAKNDTIYAGEDGTFSISGGRDKLYLDGGDVEILLGDGEVEGVTEIVEGFDLETDVIKVNDAENLYIIETGGRLQVKKNDSVLYFDELESFDDANGLQIQSGGEIYTLRSDYEGVSNTDYFWQDSKNNFYRPDSTLVINDDGDHKEFFIEGGSDKLTITNFEFGVDGDRLNLKSASGLNYFNDDLLVRVNDDDWIRVQGGAGKVVNFTIDGTDYVGELGKNLTYNDDVEYYGDLNYGRGCAISVSADYEGDEVSICMNETADHTGKVKYYNGVDKIDASAFEGQSTLIGSELSDKITASQGDSSLWGGTGGNDSLIGSGDGNSFFYFIGDGNDEIHNAHDGDSVNLSDITLDQISYTEVNSWGVKLEMNDGGTLTLKNTADVTFNLGDGSKYKANYETKQFERQA